mmetsp:Transcript_17042/g.23848  ORF Transcript_17042/g.23848 Transcript_17042/m.23848 type:complete len:200 (-) Transcript_17042:175-774(-)
MGAVLGGTSSNTENDNAIRDEGQKANVYDPSAIKAVLDLSTVQAMRKKYKEDHFHSNLKLALGSLSCLVGVSAYIYPSPFPENREFLKWCVIFYFAFSSLIQAISFVFFRDVIFLTESKPFPTAKDNLYIRVISKLPRYNTKYSLTFKVILNDKPYDHVKELDIQDFFDSEGYFYEKRYWARINEFNEQALEMVQKKSQ